MDSFLHLQKHEKQECACTDLKPLNMFVSGVGNWKVFQRGFPCQEALELLAQRVLDKPIIERLKDAGKARTDEIDEAIASGTSMPRSV